MSTPDSTVSQRPTLRGSNLHARLAWLIWGVFALGVCGVTASKADLSKGSVTPEYHRAAELWWQCRTMYTEGVHGFLYLPQAAMMYTPFELLPRVVEETLWRVLGVVLLAVGVRRVCGAVFGERWRTAFLWASALAVPSALGSAANGQTNVHMAGLLALACADLIGRRWWRVAMWLALALACKPTAVVMVLLVGAVYLRPMGWRLGVVLAVLALLPFVHPSPAYVAWQYRECVVKMTAASQPGDLFQDIRGMLAEFGVVKVVMSEVDGTTTVVQTPPEVVLTAVRAIAALATLGMCWLGARRFGAVSAAMALYTLGAVYLTLFNPRTEGLSYVILGVPAALWAAREVLAKRWPTAAFLILFCLATQFSTQIALNHKNYFVRPLGAAIILGLVCVEVVRGRSRWPSDSPPTPSGPVR